MIGVRTDNNLHSMWSVLSAIGCVDIGGSMPKTCAGNFGKHNMNWTGPTCCHANIDVKYISRWSWLLIIQHSPGPALVI